MNKYVILSLLIAKAPGWLGMYAACVEGVATGSAALVLLVPGF